MQGLLKLVFGSVYSTISHQACLNLCQRVTAHWNVWKRYVSCLTPVVFMLRNSLRQSLYRFGKTDGCWLKTWAKASATCCSIEFWIFLDLGILDARYWGCFSDTSNTEWYYVCDDLILCSIYKHTLFSKAKGSLT